MSKLLVATLFAIPCVSTASAIETRLTGEISYIFNYYSDSVLFDNGLLYSDLYWQVDDQVGEWTVGFEMDPGFSDANFYAKHPVWGAISLSDEQLNWEQIDLGSWELAFETHLNNLQPTIVSFDGSITGIHLEGSIQNNDARSFELHTGTKIANYTVETFLEGDLNDTSTTEYELTVGAEIQGVDFIINSNLEAEVQWNDIAIKTDLGNGDAFMPFQIEYRPQLSENLVLDSNVIFNGSHTRILAELIMEF